MTDKTATQIAQSDRDESRLNWEVQRFFERWTPKDPREAAEFQAQFHSVTRAIYGDMQKPVTACFESMMLARPMAPIIVKTNTD